MSKPEQSDTKREPLIVYATLMQSANDSAIDPVSIGHFLGRHVALIVAAATLGAAASFGASYLVPRSYRAEMTLEPVSAGEEMGGLGGLKSQLGAVAGLLGAEIGEIGNSTAASLALLRSRRLVSEFIEARKLMPLLFASRWDSARLDWRPSRWQAPTIQDGYERFVTEILSVREDTKTGLVLVAIEWRDPVEAAAWANDLIGMANRFMAEQTSANTARRIEYLNQELRSTNEVGLRKAIYALIETEIRSRMLARTRPEYAFRVLDPAVPPQLDRYVSPRRVLYLIAGGLLSAAVGMLVGALHERRLARSRDR